MKKLVLSIVLLLSACSPHRTSEIPPEKLEGPRIPVEAMVISEMEPLHLSGPWMDQFFQEWFSDPKHGWPTQKDVEEWEKQKGYRR